MRIIGGKLRRKKIIYTNSVTTRPLRDIVKENIFNLLEHSKDIDIILKNSEVLDLYAGVGSFGLECISRNAKKVYFVEKDPIAIKHLRKNIDHLKVSNMIKLFPGDITNFLKSFTEDQKFDIIFFDPPYKDKSYINLISLIKSQKIIKKKHLIIIHREIDIEENLEDFLNILLIKKYGRSKILFGVFIK